MTRMRGCWPAVAALAFAFAVAAPGWAQTSTASLRGSVTDEAGQAVAGASIVAINTDTGFTITAESSAGGAYNLTLPPGSYEITVAASGKESLSESVRAQVGQALTVDFQLTGAARVEEEVTVTSAPLMAETRTSELATNVTTEQIELLPQNSRNFLNFAALAPGVRFTDNQDEAGQKFRSGGLDSRQINVFVDGLSYKNDLLQGGAFMQDSSRGNPFPQNAVQEFRVLTQNYKAEYEKAAAAVITAVTKSGGNDWHGDAFYLFQDKGMVEQDDFSQARGEKKPEYERTQLGLSFGGPIQRDRFHFFLSFEQNEQDRFRSIFRGADYGRAPANVQAFLGQFPLGATLSPFESKLYFGKLSWQPAASQHLDFSYHVRDEEEIRGFENQRVAQGAELFEISTDAAVAKHIWFTGRSTNEIGLTFQELRWNPTAVDKSTPRQNYFGILDVGGKDATQDFQQDKIGLRDDFTYPFSWRGEHTAKAGLSVNWLDYTIEKFLFDNPLFEFRSDEQWQFPFQARLGFGDPGLEFSNTQLGLYLQDDWQVGRWLFNLGLRWDYESNMINNDYVTPPNVVAALQNACRTYDQPVGGRTTWCLPDFLDFDRYTTDGDDRDDYYGMVQPRLGFSWDARGDGRTVLFGGWGKYYDRVVLNDIFDEEYRQDWLIYSFCFSATGAPAPNCSVPAIQWNPSFLSAAGLRNLINSGVAAGPEVWLVANDLRPPRSDQWTLGIRQQFGEWNGSLSYAGVRGYNGLSYFFGDNPPGTPFSERFGGNVRIPGFARVFITSNARRQYYDAIYLTVDRPYTAGSRWGVNFAYTYAEAEQTGTDNPGEGIYFGAFDYRSPDDYYKFPGTNDERHRIVATGTVGLPANFRFSSFLTLGSGVPFTLFDDSNAATGFRVRWNEGRPPKEEFLSAEWAYASLDLRLDWEVDIADAVTLGLIGEAFNVTDFDNNGCFENFIPRPPGVNARLGQPNCQFNTRRYQVGAAVRF